MSTQPPTTQPRKASRPVPGRGVLSWALAAALTALPGCGKGSRPDSPQINAGLSDLLGDEPDHAEIAGDDQAGATDPSPASESELQAMIDRQVAELTGAYEQDAASQESATQPDESAPDVSLGSLLGGGDESATPEATNSTLVEATSASEIEDPAAPEPLGLNQLYAKLDEALGRELASTSEPFRMAVVAIAPAAGQGRDPAGAIAPGTAAGDRLSPEEHESALAVATLLGSLLGSEEGAPDRAHVLREFGEQLGKTVGLQIPTAKLCTRVRGFGKYEEFSSTSFLAGRPIRALVYVEVDQFEHGQVDTSSLGGIPVEEEWSIDVSQTLELYHEADKPILAWKRPEEVVVQTSRNKQRDFYLLTEIILPQTLTVGSYQLKVVVRDRVGGERAEALIPIKVVADPTLAWTPD